LLPIVADRCTVGSSAESDLVVNDPSVSRTHVLLEQLGGAWFVEDLGSRNGTYLNGQRITGRRVVRPGDEIRLGLVRVVLGGVVSGSGPATSLVDEPPVLTRRERDVLVALCRPLRSGDEPLPTGVVTFLATDVVGSTRLWQDLPDCPGTTGRTSPGRRSGGGAP
jgi:pSer/pThr/pTyr-binding forkhead associated (FHA) protein